VLETSEEQRRILEKAVEVDPPPPPPDARNTGSGKANALALGALSVPGTNGRDQLSTCQVLGAKCVSEAKKKFVFKDEEELS
jgi:hypothetical protein